MVSHVHQLAYCWCYHFARHKKPIFWINHIVYKELWIKVVESSCKISQSTVCRPKCCTISPL